jgi:hypothetical protein
MIGRWWRRLRNRLQRDADLAVLWPELQGVLDTREEALWAFRQHMETDPAYSDLSTREKREYIEQMR